MNTHYPDKIRRKLPLLAITVLSLLQMPCFAWDFAEHRKIGDRAMSLLPARLAEEGIFANEAEADKAILSILNMSHMEGTNAYAMNELTQLPNIITYGTTGRRPC